jgi:hypothetical protein
MDIGMGKGQGVQGFHNIAHARRFAVASLANVRLRAFVRFPGGRLRLAVLGPSGVRGAVPLGAEVLMCREVQTYLSCTRLCCR